MERHPGTLARCLKNRLDLFTGERHPSRMATDYPNRSNRNEYPGYAAGPMKRTGEMKLRLDFNPHRCVLIAVSKPKK